MHSRLAFAALLLALSVAPALPQSAPSPPASSPAKSRLLPLGVARSGIVQSIAVREGAHVEAGEVLVRLDCRPLEKEIAYRAASLAAAEAAFARVRNGPRPEEIAIGEAAVGVAEARAEEARAALDRASAMPIDVAITRAQLLIVERDDRIAGAQLLDARKKLALLRAGSRAEDIAEAEARRDAAAAFLDEGKAELEQCAVRAPAAGVVHVVATLGAFVSVFAPTPLVQLTTDAGAE
jgi:HlyD family secretion protein